MAERVVVIDDDLADLLRQHLPLIAERLVDPDPTAGLTIDEAARHLRLSERTVADLVADGTIRCVRFGRRVVIPRTEIARLLEDDSKDVPLRSAS